MLVAVPAMIRPPTKAAMPASNGGVGPRRSAQPPLLAGIAAFVGGLIIAGTATSMATVVAGRAVQGLGGGALVLALYVVVGHTYPQSVQPRVFSPFPPSPPCARSSPSTPTPRRPSSASVPAGGACCAGSAPALPRWRCTGVGSRTPRSPWPPASSG